MKAAVIYNPGDIRLIDVEEPEPKENEVLVKVKACGFCGTDFATYKGVYYANFPVILGHEFSGEVVDVGNSVKKVKAGDRVTVDPNIVCHNCYFCNIGEEHLCENLATIGTHRNGGFTEYCAVPETNIFLMEKDISFEKGAMTEPLACAMRGIEMANIKSGDTLLVLGAGAMGILMVLLARIAGASNIIISEVIGERRRIAKECGADIVINPNEKNVLEEVKKVKYCGADAVIDCTGSTKVAELSLKYSRRGGHIVWYSVYPSNETVPVAPFNMNENELSIHGSFNNPYTQKRALELLASGKVNTEKIVYPFVELKDFSKILEIFGKEGSMKIMVKM